MELNSRNTFEIIGGPALLQRDARLFVRVYQPGRNFAAASPLSEGTGDTNFPDYGVRPGSDLIVIGRVANDRFSMEDLADPVFTITTSEGTGTGFMISKDGLALTNAHVVQASRQFTAQLSDGTSVAGRVIRMNSATDAALVQVKCASSCVSAPLGENADVQIGNDVYAVGAPFGLGQSLSRGIISGVRRLEGSMWLQTDAAVNRGNSGGPLVDGSTSRA